MGRMVVVWVVVLMVVSLLTSACRGPTPAPTPEEAKVALVLQLSSPAFDEGGTIPRKYTCDGEDLSPPLNWTDVPEGTQSLALIADDPDAPAGTFVHWVLYNIPSHLTSLPEGVATSPTVDDIGTQGVNDFRKTGYGGPCPPKGPAHRYFFKLYALDTSLDLEPGATAADLQKAMEGHILARGELMGRYRR